MKYFIFSFLFLALITRQSVALSFTTQHAINARRNQRILGNKNMLIESLLTLLCSKCREGYGMRVKDVHLLSQSKAIDAIISLFKQAFSAKLAARVVVHKNLDSIHEYVPKEILPKDYGGNEKPLDELHSDFLDVLSEKDFLEYITEMNQATTNEELRIATDENQSLGMPGTFRTLSVD